jgi:predicted RNA binding protein YcfA (HicA-like mRNA interferase family)
MPKKQVTYSRLIRILQDLGFEMTRVRGSHRVFKHPGSSTLIVLPYRSGREPAQRIHIAAVERILSETGFLSKEEFEELIRQ